MICLHTWSLSFGNLALAAEHARASWQVEPAYRWTATDAQELIVDDLTWALRKLCHRHRDDGHPAHMRRLRALRLVSRHLREAGFRQMRATSLKDRHVRALLERWQGEGLSVRTIEMRLADLRWWADKIGKAERIPSLVKERKRNFPRLDADLGNSHFTTCH